MFGDPRLPDRFWDKVMTEPNTGCWLWTGLVTKTGTPLYQLTVQTNTAQHVSAHHVAFAAFIGTPSIEFGLKVSRTCDETTCCNPDHLYARPRSVAQSRKEFRLSAARRAVGENPEFGIARRIRDEGSDLGGDARVRAAIERWREASHLSLNKSQRKARRKYHARYKFHKIKSTYGLSKTQYQELIDSQNGKCLICLVEFATLNSRKTHVDHCHETGRIRGILCHKCNIGVGMFDDKPELLSRAIAYLRKAG